VIKFLLDEQPFILFIYGYASEWRGMIDIEGDGCGIALLVVSLL